MQALILDKDFQYKLVIKPVPTLKDRQVLVKIRYSALNRRDVWMAMVRHCCCVVLHFD
jgi:NADPH:quinone reductase-like Zn-dependent oxidoreductase